MWVIPAKRPCYGKLFPDVGGREVNRQQGGEVFGCRRNSLGADARSIEIAVDEAKWERCVDCPHHRSCYDLSMAKLLFTHAMLARN